MKTKIFALVAVMFVVQLVNVTPAKASDFVYLDVVNSTMWPVVNMNRLRHFTILAQNNSNQNLTNVQAVVRFYDASNKLIQEANSYGDLLSITGPGETVGINWSPPISAIRYSILAVGGLPTSQSPNRNFRVNSSAWTANSGGYRFFTVSVTNLNRDTAEALSFQVICYNSNGVYSFNGPTFPSSLGSAQTTSLSVISEVATDPPCDSPLVTIDSTSAPNPFSRPSVPSPPSGSSGNGQVSLSWAPPTDTGGGPTTYHVYSYRDGVNLPSSSCTTSSTSCVISGLSNGIAYTFKVSAENSVGESLLSEPSIEIVPKASYLVTYVYNSATGGNATANASYTTGGTAITLPTPSRVGYTFAGWYANAGFGTKLGDAGSTFSPNGSVQALSAYAKWNPNMYTVTYNPNFEAMGETPTSHTISYPYSTSARVFWDGFNSANDGYVLTSWNTKANGSGLSYLANGSESFMIGSSDIVLYAQWTKAIVITSQPKVTGTAKVGKTLVAVVGTWDLPAPVISYQWYSCRTKVSTAKSTRPSSCWAINSATGTSFKLKSLQKGTYVTFAVTAVRGSLFVRWWAKSSTQVK